MQRNTMEKMGENFKHTLTFEFWYIYLQVEVIFHYFSRLKTATKNSIKAVIAPFTSKYEIHKISVSKA